MKVFLSWSGERSRLVAEAFCDFFQKHLQATEPWISKDINKGARWSEEIARQLEETKVGILCLTSDNLSSEWLHFEAGALAKWRDAYVCTFLLDIHPTDVTGPLIQFQHTRFDREDFGKLIQTINGAVQQAKERSLSENILAEIFDKAWPDLQEKLSTICEMKVGQTAIVRSADEKMDELLMRLRSVAADVETIKNQHENESTNSQMVAAVLRSRNSQPKTVQNVPGGLGSIERTMLYDAGQYKGPYGGLGGIAGQGIGNSIAGIAGTGIASKLGDFAGGGIANSLGSIAGGGIANALGGIAGGGVADSLRGIVIDENATRNTLGAAIGATNPFVLSPEKKEGDSE